MSNFIGPYLAFHQGKPQAWCFFEVTEDKTLCFIWQNAAWNVWTPTDDSTVFYTYAPDEAKFIPFVLTKTHALFKAPIFEYISANGEVSQKSNAMFKASLQANGVIWPLAHLKASQFNIELTHLPAQCKAEDIQEMPVLPSSITVTVPTPTQAKVNHNKIVSIEGAFRRCKGLEFSVNSRLSIFQQSLIVQFIATNGDWPFNGGDEQAQITLGLNILHGHMHQANNLPSITQYRNPLFLAKLLTPSFYPEDKEDISYQTTVADVWCFINVLLAHGIRLLGYGKPIKLPRPPHGSGLRANEYLAKHDAAYLENTQSLTDTQEIVHELVMDYAQAYQLPDLNEAFTTGELRSIIATLKAMVENRVIVSHLAQTLRSTIASFLDSDNNNEAVSNLLMFSCRTLLEAAYKASVDSLWEKLENLTEDKDDTALMTQVAKLVIAIEDTSFYESKLVEHALSTEKINRLQARIAQEKFANIHQISVFGVSASSSSSSANAPEEPNLPGSSLT